MKNVLFLWILMLSLLVTPWASAQDEADIPTQVVEFFQQLAEISEHQRDNCEAMGSELNAYLDEHQAVLKDASYSTEAASEEQEKTIMGLVEKLGKNAGECYETKSVDQFVQRFTTLSDELGAP